MDMATFATHDHGYISFPDIDASPSLVLSILAAGRAETDYDMKFFTGWGNIIILPLSFFLSFSSWITIMYSKRAERRMTKGGGDIGRGKNIAIEKLSREDL